MVKFRINLLILHSFYKLIIILVVFSTCTLFTGTYVHNCFANLGQIKIKVLRVTGLKILGRVDSQI